MNTRILSVLTRTWASVLVVLGAAVRLTVISTLAELAGLAFVVYGVGLIYRPAAFILAGLFLVLIGVALDPPAPKVPARGPDL